ncbi:MAG: biotin transporter BioY, partial [Eubacterium sp.]
NRIFSTIVAILSAIFVDLFGSIWMMFVSDIALVPALIAGFLPFIVLDVVKAVIAAQIVPQVRKIVHQN